MRWSGSLPRVAPGHPRKPAYPTAPVNQRQLALGHADRIKQVTWRQGTKAAKGNPTVAMTSHFLAIRVRPADRDIARVGDGSLPAWMELTTIGPAGMRTG